MFINVVFTLLPSIIFTTAMRAEMPVLANSTIKNGQGPKKAPRAPISFQSPAPNARIRTNGSKSARPKPAPSKASATPCHPAVAKFTAMPAKKAGTVSQLGIRRERQSRHPAKPVSTSAHTHTAPRTSNKILRFSDTTNFIQISDRESRPCSRWRAQCPHCVFTSSRVRRQIGRRVRKGITYCSPGRSYRSHAHKGNQDHEQGILGQVLAFLTLPQRLERSHIGPPGSRRNPGYQGKH